MATEGTFSTAPRVVILSRDHTLARAELEELCSRGMQCLRWSSAYEVAAELLSGTVDALVLDLRMLTGRNTRVLQIARERGVEVLAVGMLPASVSTENLSGVRLAGMRDLPGILQQLGTYVPIEPEEPPTPTSAEPAKPAEAAVPPVAEPPPVEDPPAEAPPEIPQEPPLDHVKRPEHIEDLHGILTPEELSALLENEL